MKKIVFCIAVILFVLYSQTIYANEKKSWVSYLSEYCEKYDLEDYEYLMVAIYRAEGSRKANRVTTNNDGTKDYGYFSINDVWVDAALRGTKNRKRSILEPEVNIECACYIMRYWKRKLEKQGYPVNELTLTVCWHMPSDLDDVLEGKTKNNGYKFYKKTIGFIG